MFKFLGGPSARDTQIEKFQEGFPKAIQKQADKSLFDLPFQIDKRSYTLRIFLPPKFPEEKPVLQLLTPLRHQWINQYNQVVGHPYLSQWDSKYELITLVKEVNDELQSFSRKPEAKDDPASTMNQNFVDNAPPSYRAAAMIDETIRRSVRSDATSPSKTQDEGFKTPVPPIPTHFSELNSMSLEEIEDLNGDTVAFQAFLMSLDSVKTMCDMREQVIEENAKIAQSNLEHKEELDALRSEAISSQAALQEIKNRFDAKARAQIDADARRCSDGAVLETIRQAVSNADDESEELVSALSYGDMRADEFVKAYLPLRKTYHRRNAAIEYSHRWTATSF